MSYFDYVETFHYDEGMRLSKSSLQSQYEKILRKREIVYEVLDLNYGDDDLISKFANQYAATMICLIATNCQPTMEEWIDFSAELKAYFSFLYYVKTRKDESSNIPLDFLKSKFCFKSKSKKIQELLYRYQEISNDLIANEKQNCLSDSEAESIIEEVTKSVHLSRAIKCATVDCMQRMKAEYSKIIDADTYSYKVLSWSVLYLLELKKPAENSLKFKEEQFNDYLHASEQANKYMNLFAPQKRKWWDLFKSQEPAQPASFRMPEYEFEKRTNLLNEFCNRSVGAFNEISEDLSVISVPFCIALGWTIVLAEMGDRPFPNQSYYYDRVDLFARIANFSEAKYNINKDTLNFIINQFAKYVASDVKYSDNWTSTIAIPVEFYYHSSATESGLISNTARNEFFSDIINLYEHYLRKNNEKMATDVLIKLFITMCITMKRI